MATDVNFYKARVEKLERCLKDACTVLHENGCCLVKLKPETLSLYNDILAQDVKARALDKLNFDDMVTLGFINPRHAGKYLPLNGATVLDTLIKEIGSILAESSPYYIRRIFTIDQHVNYVRFNDVVIRCENRGLEVPIKCHITIDPQTKHNSTLMTIDVTVNVT